MLCLSIASQASFKFANWSVVCLWSLGHLNIMYFVYAFSCCLDTVDLPMLFIFGFGIESVGSRALVTMSLMFFGLL